MDTLRCFLPALALLAYGLNLGAAQPPLVTKTFAVADLVIPLPSPGAISGDKPSAPGKTLEKGLIEHIKLNVAPNSWDIAGGNGSIEYFPLTMALVATQSPAVLEQVETLLADLRREQDRQVALEIRIISLPAECRASPIKKDATEAFLTEKEASAFLQMAQSERLVNVMQAPKLTLFHGQQAELAVTDSHSFVSGVEVRAQSEKLELTPKVEQIEDGMRIVMHPQISKDNRFVLIDLKGDFRAHEMDLVEAVRIPTKKGRDLSQFIERPRATHLRCQAEVCLADGQSVLLAAGERERTVATDPVPLLSEIPIVSDWLAKPGKKRVTEKLLVMVTPRVIVHEEEEIVRAPSAEEQEPPAPAVTKDPVGDLVNKYRAACAAGHHDEAAALAVRALALDPCCFAEKHHKSK